jgi:hypothetical protein
MRTGGKIPHHITGMDSGSEAAGCIPDVDVPDRAGTYAAPAIVYRARLEAVAADCLGWPGKADGLCSVGNS